MESICQVEDARVQLGNFIKIIPLLGNMKTERRILNVCRSRPLWPNFLVKINFCTQLFKPGQFPLEPEYFASDAQSGNPIKIKGQRDNINATDGVNMIQT